MGQTSVSTPNSSIAISSSLTISSCHNALYHTYPVHECDSEVEQRCVIDARSSVRRQIKKCKISDSSREAAAGACSHHARNRKHTSRQSRIEGNLHWWIRLVPSRGQVVCVLRREMQLRATRSHLQAHLTVHNCRCVGVRHSAESWQNFPELCSKQIRIRTWSSDSLFSLPSPHKNVTPFHRRPMPWSQR